MFGYELNINLGHQNMVYSANLSESDAMGIHSQSI